MTVYWFALVPFLAVVFLLVGSILNAPEAHDD